MESIKSKAVHGVYWSFLDIAGVQIIKFVLGIFLARLLLPEQFGLIGMLTIFIAIAQSILDSGFGAALVQKKDSTQVDFCTIFYFQIAIGLIIYTVLYISAPLIAAFYNQTKLTLITRVLSISIIINSFGWIHGTILSKNIDFKIQANVSLFSVLLSGVVGISLAIKEFGVWALIAQQVTNSLFRLILFWFLNSWRPTLIFSFNSLKGMFKFGSRIFISGMLNQVFENIYFIICGKLFSIRELGLFTRAKTFADVPSYTMSTILGKVAFPVFSLIQNDKKKVIVGLKRIYTLTALINFTVLLCLSVISNNLVMVFLTEKWIESAPFLKMLFLCGVFSPIYIIGMDAIRALGYSGVFMKIEIFKKILVVMNIIITFKFGLNYLIMGMVIISVLSYVISSYFVHVIVGYDIREQFLDILPYFSISVFTATGVYIVGVFVKMSCWSELLLQVTVGILIWVSFCFGFKFMAFKELQELVIDKLAGKPLIVK